MVRTIAVALALYPFAGAAMAQTKFTVRTLPPLAGDVKANPAVGNAHGVIAGYSISGTNVTRPTLWVGGVAQPIAELPGGKISYVTAINQLGEVAGYIAAPPKFRPEKAWIWDAVNGVRELAGPVANSTAAAYGINFHGVVCGSTTNASGINQATTWDRAGNATVLGAPAGYLAGVALSINDSGELAGGASGSATPSQTGFRWSPGSGFQLLRSPTLGKETEANGIRSDGRVVGMDWATWQVCTWDGTNPTLRGLGPNGVASHGLTEIAQGWILATAYSFGGAELFESSGARRVADLFPPSWNVITTSLTSLSDSGVLLGNYSSSSVNAVGFVLEPEARVEVEGGQAAGSLAFRHRAPTHPGATAATLVSLTGMSTPLSVGRGASVLLDADPYTFAYLGLPNAGFVTLDANGDATTAALLIADPSLAGLGAWVCGVVFVPGAAPATTNTLPFFLE